MLYSVFIAWVVTVVQRRLGLQVMCDPVIAAGSIHAHFIFVWGNYICCLILRVFALYVGHIL